MIIALSGCLFLIPQPRIGTITNQVINDSIYLVGGFDGGQNGGCAVPGCQGQMQVYHTANNTWERLGDLPYVRRFLLFVLPI
jgi:hypothetical protein